MDFDGSTTEERWYQLFFDLGENDAKIDREENLTGRPKLLRDHIREIGQLRESLNEVSALDPANIRPKLDSVKDVIRFNQISRAVPLENKFVKDKIQRRHYNSVVKDADLAIEGMYNALTPHTYRSIAQDNRIPVRTRGNLPADQVIIHLERCAKTQRTKLLEIESPTRRKIAQGMLDNFDQAKSVYKDVQKELISQIEKEDKAEKRRVKRLQKKEGKGLDV